MGLFMPQGRGRGFLMIWGFEDFWGGGVVCWFEGGRGLQFIALSGVCPHFILFMHLTPSKIILAMLF